MKLRKGRFLKGICVAALGAGLLVGFGNALFAAGTQPVKITFRYFAWPQSEKFAGKLVEAFNAKYMPKIELVFQPWAGTTDGERVKMLTILNAHGSTPDIIFADSPWTSEFAAAGWLLPIDQFLDNKEEFQQDFYPFANAVVSYQGKLYGIIKQIDMSILFYRTDILSDAGLKYPRTIDQLIDVVQKVAKPPRLWGFAFQGAQYEGLVCAWIELLHNYGGSILGESIENPAGGEVGNRTSHLESEAAIKATQLLYDLIFKYKVSPPGVTTYTEMEARKAFYTGNVAMVRDWSEHVTEADNPETSEVASKWDAASIPAGPAGSHTCIGGWVWAINKFTKHPKEAFIALKFMTNTAQQKLSLLTDGGQPSRRSVWTDPELREDSIWGHFGPLLQGVAETGVPRPLSPIWPAQSDVISRAIHKVFTNEMTAKEAMKWADQEIQKIENEYRD